MGMKRVQTAFFGYAGGLFPANIAEQLPKIEAARGPYDFWIDMQGRVRDDYGHLDLKKVRQVLEICALRIRTATV